VRKLYNTPLIAIGAMWADLVEGGRRHMLLEGSELADPVDFSIPRCAGSVEEAVGWIRANREEWLRAQAAAK
jgi:hypothetical protein